VMMRAFFDGSTLDVRVALNLTGATESTLPYVDVGVLSNLPPYQGRARHIIVLDTTASPPPVGVVLDGVNYVTLDRCAAAEIDSNETQLRLQIPVEYLEQPPYVLEWYLPGLDSPLTVTAEQVERLPDFNGYAPACEQGWNLVYATQRYVELLGIADIRAVTRGCALQVNHEIACWNNPNSAEPAPSIPSGPFTQIGVSGTLQVCGIRENSSLDCFQLSGSLGSIPVPSVPSGAFKQISEYGNCGILTSGGVQCWALPDDPTTQSIDGDFVKVAGDAELGCAVDSNGGLTCWIVPFGVEPGPYYDLALLDGKYKDVAVGSGVICVLTVEGQVDCLTENLADSKVRLAGGPYHWIGGPWSICALDDADRATCIGEFVQSVPPYAFSSVAIGAWIQPLCGILTDDRLTCWDADGYTLP
jgi:hypothetical protein